MAGGIPEGRTSAVAHLAGSDRRFLFLQGPHGPFFRALGGLLRLAGAEVWRVGFTAGDRAFWGAEGYIAHRDGPGAWPEHCTRLMAEKRITDLVLYGDTRPIHAAAVALARERGITVHVFEEGYLRPYWITYERGGSNGHSPLMQLPVETMRAALGEADAALPAAPAGWGEIRQHMVYGALYHFFVLALNRGYRGFRPHREVTVAREFGLHLRRLLATPFLAVERWLTSARLGWGGRPYHLVLLQLAHDASFRDHGPFASMEAFVEVVIRGFAAGAPAHHRLVFKAHPLEDGRIPLRRMIRSAAAAAGIADRVDYVPGGKLARLLAEARSAVTVNSTAAQQALWRGLPVKCFGQAVYAKPEFVSAQPLPEFFARPRRPDGGAYRDFRRFLLETSQVPGGFYALGGRRRALRRVVDLVLAPHDPYAALLQRAEAPRQQLRRAARLGD
jgi:capsular polysaccharide export protein